LAVTSTTSTLLTTLASAAANAAQAKTSIYVDLINGQIDKQLKAKIAALKDPTDTVVLQSQQSTIDQLNQQLTQANTIAGLFSNNSNVLSSMSSNLANLQNAIAAGNTQSFDQFLSQANNDLYNLTIVPPIAPYQYVPIEQFKTDGLGIQSSANYDLTTAAGKAAAAADVQNAQQTALSLSAIGTSNQLIAYSNSNALATQINTMTTALQKAQDNNQNYIATQTANLTQLAQTQEHLIQLALGNTTQLSTALALMTALTDVATSPYGVLSTQATAAATAAQSSTSTTSAASRTLASASTSPAVLSLLT
jgi:hypothetical protein